MPKKNNPEQNMDLQQLPGDIKLALKYMGVNPKGKKKEEDYKAYVNNLKTELKSKLNGNEPRPQRIKIHFENMDPILANLKVAAIKNTEEYRFTTQYDGLDQKVGSAVSSKAAVKTLGKYMSATLNPFMETAFGKEEGRRKVRQEEIDKKKEEIDEKLAKIKAEIEKAEEEIQKAEEKVSEKKKKIEKEPNEQEKEKLRNELREEREKLKQSRQNKSEKIFEKDKVWVEGEKVREEKNPYFGSEDLILVNGLPVREHLQRMCKDGSLVLRNEEDKKNAIANYVGTALQNGYKVEAYVPDEKTGKIPERLVEMIPDGAKLADMRLLPERAWDKFCNFFGIQTDRQKHNLSVTQYYSNLNKTKMKMKKLLGKRLEPAPETEYRADRQEKNYEEVSDALVQEVETLYGKDLSDEIKAEYMQIALSLDSKKEEYGEDYFSHLTSEEREMDDRREASLEYRIEEEMEEDGEEFDFD